MGESVAADVNACRAEVSSLRSELAGLRGALDELSARTVADQERVMHTLRIVRDDDTRAWRALWRLRSGDEYALAYDEDEPLVTVVITTYSNWHLLRERALPSVLAQTYERFECIVVGDAAPPQAAEVVESFGDSRLRFINLPYRGPYPARPEDAWHVSGTTPYNTALAVANGRWIGSVSDDDALRPRYVESLLALARETRAEVAYGQINQRDPDGTVTVLGVFPPELGHWGTQSSLIHSGLRYMGLQVSDWLFRIPNDWSLADRMLRIGVRFEMLAEPVVDYYPSKLWKHDRPEPRAF
jgi:glycosyltransferase involved in cell wall biosynthesis